MLTAAGLVLSSLPLLVLALDLPSLHPRELKRRLTDEEWRALVGDTVITGGDGSASRWHDVDVVVPSLSAQPQTPRPRRSSSAAAPPPTPPTLRLDAHRLGRSLTIAGLRAVAAPVAAGRIALVARRHDGRTEPLPADLVEPACFYSSRSPTHAALSVCGGLRGVIKPPGDELYVISPVPERLLAASEWERGDEAASASGEPAAFGRLALRPHLVVRKAWNGTRADDDDARFCGVRDGHGQGGERERERGGRRGRSPLVPLSPPPVHVETAVFVDSDMLRLMAANFPIDTERHVVRFVLAMVNAVQLLYEEPSLGQPVVFVVKRLELLHADPQGLRRSHDIDTFLGNFCAWQRGENPAGDGDPLHWDHALILTGLDLFVRAKSGKLTSQVVGLAPVAGMCTPTSSCTVNEGRHFESVYVVAHEIGHNLGMRHDGPLADNECDPTSYLMSPTLGSGKITWSHCSRRYLQKFLRSSQSRCLMDRDDERQLDHGAQGLLPGERFDADQQCMLKYGAGSRHASGSQPPADLCRDLHCRRDRFTWTSHPALEGTACGTDKWCRGGRCVPRSSEAGGGAVDGGWGEWSSPSECASGCLHGASTGITLSHRRCDSPRPERGGAVCAGGDRKHHTCSTHQCENVPQMTVRDFADEVCLRAREVDSELVGTGLQKVSSDAEEACAVWCYKRNGGSKSRGWTFPDGTVCRTRMSQHAERSPTSFCIAGRCQVFTCGDDNDSSLALLASDADACLGQGQQQATVGGRGKRRETVVGAWQPTSDCYYNCVTPGSGLRLVERRDCLQCNVTASLQLCKPDTQVCGKVKSTLQHSTQICSGYRQRVRRLSGIGAQLSPAVEDPDRSCRVACQDESVSHRFYLVNGEDGWFPFGTDCSKGDTTKRAFCVRGKCLEFGSDDTPLHESEYVLPAAASGGGQRQRRRRSYDRSVTVRATLDERTLADMVRYLNRTNGGELGVREAGSSKGGAGRGEGELDLDNPVTGDYLDLGLDLDWTRRNDVDSVLEDTI